MALVVCNLANLSIDLLGLTNDGVLFLIKSSVSFSNLSRSS